MEVKPGYKLTEVGVIPEQWAVVSLKNLGNIRTGPFGTLLKANEYSSSDGVPLISVGEVGEGILQVIKHTPLIPEVVVRRLPEYVLNDGDIVLARKGAVDRSALVTPNQHGWFLGSDCIRIRLSKSCHAAFIAWQFQRYEIRSWLLTNATGTTMPSMNQEILNRISIPLPPLPEQQAIAAALGDVDALIASLDRLIAKKRDLKHAAMQQLLTGQTRLPGFCGEWEVTTLGSCLSESPKYGINAPAVAYSERLPAYIRITDISEEGRFSPSPLVSVQAEACERYTLKSGDLVFARTGASVGKAYRYNPTDGPLVYAGFLIRVRPNPCVLNSGLLAAYVTTKAYWNWVRLMSMRSGQPGINGNEFASMPVPLPPLKEQTAIAEVLTDMDAEITTLEARRDKTRLLKQGMMQELLTGRIRLV